jgi:pimeloyl-ACP methyl ester carboxylesterase
LTVDGLGLNVVDYGPAAGRDGDAALPPLLLLHGGMSHARWFDPLAPLLACAYRPFAIDRRGHGDSDWTDVERYGWENDLADTAAAAKQLDGGPWTVVGHSQGGLLAADLALCGPGLVTALVLLDVPLRPSSASMRRTGAALRKVPQLRWPSLDAAVRAFRPFPLPHRVPPDVLERIARMSFKPTDDGGYTSKFHWKSMRTGRPRDGRPVAPFAERIRGIAAPTLCLRGEESTLLSREDHAEMVRRLPTARAVEIPRTTHNLHVEEPELVAHAILEFAGLLAGA